MFSSMLEVLKSPRSREEKKKTTNKEREKENIYSTSKLNTEYINSAVSVHSEQHEPHKKAWMHFDFVFVFLHWSWAFLLLSFIYTSLSVLSVWPLLLLVLLRFHCFNRGACIGVARSSTTYRTDKACQFSGANKSSDRSIR